jgi:isoprenylcysteine carboxyl methyltransferase (ICMT) family protein YpbQ
MNLGAYTFNLVGRLHVCLLLSWALKRLLQTWAFTCLTWLGAYTFVYLLLSWALKRLLQTWAFTRIDLGAKAPTTNGIIHSRIPCIDTP